MSRMMVRVSLEGYVLTLYLVLINNLPTYLTVYCSFTMYGP